MITTTTLPAGIANSSYSAQVTAVGGTTPYSWSATGLPAGLSINAATGVISGTPTTLGTSTAAITVTDSTNPTHLQNTANLSITIVNPLVITTAALPDAKRHDPNFFLGNRVRTCICDDVDVAKAALRKSMASYWLMPNYRNYWKETGYADEMADAEALIAAGRAAEMPDRLTDRWLADCTLFGPAGKVREGVEAWRAAGITTPVVVPISPDGNQKRAIDAVFKAFE